MSFKFHSRLSFRLIFWVGLILLIGFSVSSYFDIKYHKKESIENLLISTNRLANIIKLETNAVMRVDARDDINPMLHRIARQEGIEDIRIYDKAGRITYSNNTREIGTQIDIKAAACIVCHATHPPLETVSLEKRARMFDSPPGARYLGIITPIASGSP